MITLVSFNELARQALKTGYVLELGVADGNSFRELCAAVYPRKVYGFDSFRGLPEDWTDYYTRGMFDRHGNPPPPVANGEYVVGWVEDTLPPWCQEHTDEVAFVHLDVDLYKPTLFALMHMQHRFVPGTILVFDEYDDSLPGHEHEQRAFAEFKQHTGWQAEFVGRRTAYAHAFRLTNRGEDA